MIYICTTCKGTNVQTHKCTEELGNVEINYCDDCAYFCTLETCTPEEYLAKLGGVSCGLNADWCVQTWHFEPTGAANTHQGDYYILDLEDDERPDAFELVQRYYLESGDNLINTIAQGDAETMVAVVRALLKAWEARQ